MPEKQTTITAHIVVNHDAEISWRDLEGALTQSLPGTSVADRSGSGDKDIVGTIESVEFFHL